LTSIVEIRGSYFTTMIFLLICEKPNSNSERGGMPKDLSIGLGFERKLFRMLDGFDS